MLKSVLSLLLMGAVAVLDVSLATADPYPVLPVQLHDLKMLDQAGALLERQGTFSEILMLFDINSPIDDFPDNNTQLPITARALVPNMETLENTARMDLESRSSISLIEKADGLFAKKESFDETLALFHMAQDYSCFADETEVTVQASQEDASYALLSSVKPEECCRAQDLEQSATVSSTTEMTQEAASTAEKQAGKDSSQEHIRNESSPQVAESVIPDRDPATVRSHHAQPERDTGRHQPQLPTEASFFRGVRSQDLRSMALADRVPGSLSVTTQYFREDPRAGPKISRDGSLRDAANLGLAASLPANLTTEARLGFSAFDSQAERMADERKNRLVDLKFAGDATLFKYGVEYRSVGQNVRYQLGPNLRMDQEGTDLWAERSFGWMSLKAVRSEFSNNVEHDIRRPRTTMALTGLVSSFNIPSGPTLSVSYSQGDSLRIGRGMVPQKSTVQQFGGSVYFWQDTYEISASTNFLPSRDKIDPSLETQSVYHDLSLIFRPTDSIWITPYFSYSEDKFKWSGAKNQNPMAQLSVTWASFIENLSLNMFGLYTRNRSTDGWMDTTMTMVMNSLVYDLGGEYKGHRTISFDVISTRYLDNVYHASSYNEFFARILYSVMSF